MTSFPKLPGVLAVLWVAFSTFSEEPRFYLHGDLGGNYTENTDARITGGRAFGRDFGGNLGLNARFDPGVRAGLAGGYQFSDYLALESELGFMVNEVDSKSRFPVVRAYLKPDSIFANVPVLFNLKIQYPTHSRWVPYAGAGIGMAVSVMDAQMLISNPNLSEFARLTIKDVDVALAYQAFVGGRYCWNDHVSLGLQYRYLATESPSWEIQNGTTLLPTTFEFGTVRTHMLSFTLDYRF